MKKPDLSKGPKTLLNPGIVLIAYLIILLVGTAVINSNEAIAICIMIAGTVLLYVPFILDLTSNKGKAKLNS